MVHQAATAASFHKQLGRGLRGLRGRGRGAGAGNREHKIKIVYSEACWTERYDSIWATDASNSFAKPGSYITSIHSTN